MSTVSASGTATLIFLIVIGPIIYFCKWLFQKCRGVQQHDTDDKHTNKGERETMSSSAYLFSLVGYAIGIGNLWRFPYIVSQNGGAACVVAYIICAILVAVPLFLYEMILGQYTKLSFVNTWKKIRPRWLSFGFSQLLMLFIVMSYYAMVIAYTIPYIVSSCVYPLPWTETGSDEYWTKVILNKYDDLHNKPPGPGPIQWKLAVSLLIFWIITYFSVAFGKNILAQITYVTVIMPVVLMLVLVIFTTQLSGADQGIAFYIGKFEASELARLDVWATALSQILFSLSPGFGTAITYSSFAKPKEDVYRACMIVAVCNSAFSIVGGFGIFAMVGHLAEEQNLPVEEVASRSGTGLAFVIIAEAMTLFGEAQNVMSVLFFVMLFTLGLDSAYAWTETLVSAVEDFMAIRGFKKFPTWKTTLFLSTIMCLFGLVFATRMGNEILDVIDMFIGTIFLLIVCFVESIIFNFDIGWRRIAYSLKSATLGNRRTPKGRNLFPTYLCRLDYHVTVPAATSLLAIYQIANVARGENYGGYPTSLVAWGWTLLAICFSMIFLTIWKCDKGSLPAVEDDSAFKPLFADQSIEDHELFEPDKTGDIVEKGAEGDAEEGSDSVSVEQEARENEVDDVENCGSQSASKA